MQLYPWLAQYLLQLPIWAHSGRGPGLPVNTLRMQCPSSSRPQKASKLDP